MIQVEKQTWLERFEMYMSLNKRDLASMLAEADKYLNPDGCAELSDEVESKTIENI